MSIDVYVAVVQTWDGETIHTSASLTEEQAEAKALLDINEMCHKSFESYHDAKEAETVDDDFCVDIHLLELDPPTIYIALVEDCGLVINCSAHPTLEAARERALVVVNVHEDWEYDDFFEMLRAMDGSEISIEIFSSGLDK